MENTKNLFEKIQAVSTDVMNIEKNLEVGSGNYSYKAVSDLDVVLKVKKAEAVHRIVSIPIKQDLIKNEVLKTVKGNHEVLVHVDTIKMTVRIIDLDEPAQFIDVESFGKGIDNSDKGLGKASTYARKYALLNAYKIATGEDPDAEKRDDMKPLTMDEKKVQVLNILHNDENIRNQTLKHFGHGTTDDLIESEIKTIYDGFKKKGKL